MPSECSEPCFFIPLHSFIAFSSPHRDPAATQAEAGGTKPWCFSLAPLSRTLCEPNSPAEVYLVCLRGEEGAERALCCSRVGAGWKHLLPVSSSVTSVQMEARCTEPGADHRSSVVVWLIPLDTRTHPGHSTRGLGGCSCTWLRRKIRLHLAMLGMWKLQHTATYSSRLPAARLALRRGGAAVYVLCLLLRPLPGPPS